MDEMSDTLIGVDSAALRDAAEILALVEADELAAVRARKALRDGALPRIDAEPEIAALLEPDETLVEARPAVLVERHAHGQPVETASGRLYLTTRRLQLVGRRMMTVRLVEIEELSVAAEQLLVTLHDGTGLSFDAGSPRLLRVLVAAAVEAARSYRSSK